MYWNVVDKVIMRRLVILTIIKMCGEAILLSLLAGIAIGVLGYINKWESALTYSNAFFIAGSLMIVAGGFSRLNAGQEWNSFRLLYTDSFRGMSSGERADFIISASNSVRLAILGVLSGLLLILISAVLTKMV